MDEEEYASDSEQSDEDYCPDAQQTENLSEVDSDDHIDDGEAHEDDSGKIKKKRKNGKNSTKKQKNDKEENVATETPIEDDKEDKSRADALWADFLSGTDPLPTKKPEPEKASIVVEEPVCDTVQPEPKKETPTKLVTQIFDFAAGKVEITKEIKETAPSATDEKAASKSSGPSNGVGRRPPFTGFKRAGGGIG